MLMTEKLAIGCVFGLLGLGVLGLAVTQTHTSPAPQAPPVQLDGQKVVTITHGDEVDLASYLEPGTRTAVEFTADW